MLILDLLNYAWRMGFMPFIGVGGSQNYEIQKSLRFRASASAYLSRTPSGASNRKTWTWSAWVKRGALTTAGTTMGLFEGYSGVNDSTRIFFNNSGSELGFADIKAGVANIVSTSADYRDPSAWMHVLVALDTTQATAANRVKLYINGVQQTSLRSSGYPAQNTDTYVNAALAHYVGNEASSANRTFDGYMSAVHFIDGQALDPSRFGKTDPATGAWVPKKYTGTYGTNGFYLGFSDGTSLTTLGNDESGNNNDWTLNNISITAGTTYDWMDDTPTNNFAVFNRLNSFNNAISVAALSAANLRINSPSGANAYGSYASSHLVDSGKWYAELTVEVIQSSANPNFSFGICPPNTSSSLPTPNYDLAAYNTAISTIRKNGSNTQTGLAAFAVNDVVGIAFDVDSLSLSFFKNGVQLGTTVSVTESSLTWQIYCAAVTNSGGSGTQYSVNFGQRPFSYTPPTGFKALCTKNLPTPAVRKGSEQFNTLLYTGNGDNPQSISGSGFQPDLIWIKGRSAVSTHVIVDSVRGRGFHSASNLSNAEATDGATAGVTTIDADGFSVDDDPASYGSTNDAASTYVAWLWKKTTGLVDIVTYTGNGANRTIAHSLGVSPKLVLVKRRSAVADWCVYAQPIGAANRLLMSQTNASAADATMWNSTAPDSSVFSLGTSVGVNANGDTYVAYLFAEVEGFSKIGSYTGNGSADGPFVWCGFRPRWVMIKRTDTTGNWVLWDTSRNTFNVSNSVLYPNLSQAEDAASVGRIGDILSNGLKIRGTDVDVNTNGGNYVFMAFAETPFKYANAR
jgi:hypothetical protein